jgi:hypothetical protein
VRPERPHCLSEADLQISTHEVTGRAVSN